jgi:hypothetical protein
VTSFVAESFGLRVSSFDWEHATRNSKPETYVCDTPHQVRT